MVVKQKIPLTYFLLNMFKKIYIGTYLANNIRIITNNISNNIIVTVEKIQRKN